jgi:hypothetical protein
MFYNFLPENRAVYEVMCQSIVEPDMPPVTIWRKLIGCWIPKARNTDAEFVIRTAFRLQQWLRERALLVRYAYIARLVLIITRFSFCLFPPTTPESYM